MSALDAICPAKINLGLRVLGRRADGYHEIVTIFQAIDLCDRLHAQDDDGLSLAVIGAALPTDETNLVMAAARLLQERVPEARGRGARLRLEKAIPVGGGLGGGSADAAGALLVLNELWALPLDSTDLARFAAELGSDVSFFLKGGTALGTGRGETVAPLPPVAARCVLLGTPPFESSTAEIFRALGSPLTAANADVTVPRLFVKFAEGNDFALATNDLQPVAFGLRSELAAFRDALVRAGAELALLSGSGSTVFGLFGAGIDVTSVSNELRVQFPDWTLRVCRTTASGVRIVPAAE